ncbi:MAG: macro domain-containing protein [Pirellulales bacterium]|nr:macro domain-containing protein [Pirellulales bacterium]
MWLIHPEGDACAAFESRFDGLPNVRVIQTRYEDCEPHDCFVTAANSFGMMTAGIDAAVVQFLGEELMKEIQLRIMDEYLGEQPVGSAFIHDTGNAEYPYLCHAPTMRVPGSIVQTDKVYSASWAAFVAVHRHNLQASRKIETVVFPAMGCGFGGMTFNESARQMAVAYRHYLHPPHRIDWDFVAKRNKAISYDGKRQVVR